MNPIEQFEQAAHRAFIQKADPLERAKKLFEISTAIEAYLNRAQTMKDPKIDAWRRALIERSLEYLKLLQRDIRMLATEIAGAPV